MIEKMRNKIKDVTISNLTYISEKGELSAIEENNVPFFKRVFAVKANKGDIEEIMLILNVNNSCFV